MTRSSRTERQTNLRLSYVNPFLILGMIFSFFGYRPSLTQGSQGAKTEWIYPDKGGKLIWGAKGGAVFAVWRTGFRKEGVGGPRGFIRIGYERNGKMTLVNFVAVEPIVGNKRGFSELEPSFVVEEGNVT